MTIYWVLTIRQILLSTLHKLSHLILETICTVSIFLIYLKIFWPCHVTCGILVP